MMKNRNCIRLVVPIESATTQHFPCSFPFSIPCLSEVSKKALTSACWGGNAGSRVRDWGSSGSQRKVAAENQGLSMFASFEGAEMWQLSAEGFCAGLWLRTS